MTRTFDDIPLAVSAFGRRAYDEGRALVADHGVRLDEVIWDADEVLWDWVMDASRMLEDFIPSLIRRDMSHREYYLVRPGIFERIWGMRHESLERGLDPHMRVWTNGYPWRIWRVAREIPGFAELLGPPARVDVDVHDSFIEHPRVFYRGDFAHAAERLLGELGNLENFLHDVSREVVELIERQLADAPFDSSFKLPELAQIRDKPGFERADILVDDRKQNINRFIESGRSGIRVISPTPRILFGKVPNVVWSEPREVLERLIGDYTLGIAEALAALSSERVMGAVEVEASGPVDDFARIQFTVDVPDARVRDEWIEPVRQLKRARA